MIGQLYLFSKYKHTVPLMYKGRHVRRKEYDHPSTNRSFQYA